MINEINKKPFQYLKGIIYLLIYKFEEEAR